MKNADIIEKLESAIHAMENHQDAAAFAVLVYLKDELAKEPQPIEHPVVAKPRRAWAWRLFS